MTNLWRRIRGALGMGITWGAAWSLTGFIPRWIFGIQSDLPFPIMFAGLGFIAGVTFSVLLMLTEGRRRFDQMSVPRFALWGALGGLLLAALFNVGVSYALAEVLAIAATFAVAGAVSASGSLALARWATNRALPAGREPESENSRLSP